jgi:hypothetical protein
MTSSRSRMGRDHVDADGIAPGDREAPLGALEAEGTYHDIVLAAGQRRADDPGARLDERPQTVGRTRRIMRDRWAPRPRQLRIGYGRQRVPRVLDSCSRIHAAMAPSTPSST